MKQTIVILSALCMALLVISGFILSTSLQQNELVIQSAAALEKVQQEKEALALEKQKTDNQLETLRASVEKLTAERDALSIQLNDTTLASQEANDAAALQESEAQRLQEELNDQYQRADRDAQLIETLTTEVETLRQKLAVSPSPDAVPTPNAFPFSVPRVTPPAV